MRLFNSRGLEVCVGDVVRYNNKPCYVEYVLWDEELVCLVTMDERKMFLRVRPDQVGCVIQKACARCISAV